MFGVWGINEFGVYSPFPGLLIELGWVESECECKFQRVFGCNINNGVRFTVTCD